MKDFLSSDDFVIRYSEKCGKTKNIYNYKVNRVVVDSLTMKLVSDDACFVQLVQSFIYLQENINIQVLFKGSPMRFVCSDVQSLSSSDENYFWVEVTLYKN